MTFVQAAITVQDQPGYAQFHARLDAAFDARDVEVFLSKVRRAGLRIRDFEGVLARGIFGKDAAALYQALPVSDQALTRERYLGQIEAVADSLRQRYSSVYAYY